MDEKGYDAQTGKLIVSVNEKFYRPNEVHHLLGDSSAIRRDLHWEPTVAFDGLVEMMAKADYDEVGRSLRA